MIYKSEITINGETYKIGCPVIGTSESIYEGLYGKIREIKSTESTENSPVTIFCDFEFPVRKKELVEMKKRFLKHGCEVDEHGEISLEYIAMTPSMIKPIAESPKTKIYVLQEEIIDKGREDFRALTYFTELADAKQALERTIVGKNSIVRDWQKQYGISENIYNSDTCYTCYKDKTHGEARYSISISAEPLYYRDYSPAAKDIAEAVAKAVEEKSAENV